MKNKAIAVVILMMLCYSSCTWLGRRTPLLNGSWKIDSLHIANDANAIGYLLLAMNKQDKSKADLAFTKDSLVFFTDEGYEKIRYTLTGANELILQDSTNEHFFVQRFSDSIIAIYSKDSSILFLRKI